MKIGDRVLILPYVEPLNCDPGYNEDMDALVGKTGVICRTLTCLFIIKLDGDDEVCDWHWVSEWLKVISDDDNGLNATMMVLNSLKGE